MNKQEAINVLLQVAAQTHRLYQGTADDHELIKQALAELSKTEDQAPVAVVEETEIQSEENT
jgi:hypothetical protein